MLFVYLSLREVARLSHPVYEIVLSSVYCHIEVSSIPGGKGIFYSHLPL